MLRKLNPEISDFSQVNYFHGSAASQLFRTNNSVYPREHVWLFLICAGLRFHPTIFGATLSNKREKHNTWHEVYADVIQQSQRFQGVALRGNSYVCQIRALACWSDTQQQSVTSPSPSLLTLTSVCPCLCVVEGHSSYAMNNIYIGNNGPPTWQCLQLIHTHTHNVVLSIHVFFFISHANLEHVKKKKKSFICYHCSSGNVIRTEEGKHMFWPLECLLAASVALAAPAPRTTQTPTFNICQTASCQTVCSVFKAMGFNLSHSVLCTYCTVLETSRNSVVRRSWTYKGLSVHATNSSQQLNSFTAMHFVL